MVGCSHVASTAATSPVLVIDVPEIDHALEKIEKLGGLTVTAKAPSATWGSRRTQGHRGQPARSLAERSAILGFDCGAGGNSSGRSHGVS
ncbi:hypothetical protein [Kibdelosporangium philippinense]|uniref:hypothetical protein n=1 Tax=Kibdelosporangium philippinense TaxID=211113 RepID=UPI00360E12BA